jgi:endonuclease/exonuclease/phosphatase (EEP) superfamily protein YafD
LILGGDANAGPLSQAYHIFTSTYHEAWRAAGFGLGHTFPTPYIAAGLQRNQIGGIELPPYIVRIDYLFFSSHWLARSTWLGPKDGVSDHRSLIANLSLGD